MDGDGVDGGADGGGGLGVELVDDAGAGAEDGDLGELLGAGVAAEGLGLAPVLEAAVDDEAEVDGAGGIA
ncbi:MAG TPA: hypothetical protein VG674_19520 [Amycolatopsis sp.]|nr:hypothetical protein [Amycolatopsis sp.]